MSSGPSKRKLKPRPGVSSCSEDTPRSARKPAIARTPRPANVAMSWGKLAWTGRTRGRGRGDAGAGKRAQEWGKIGLDGANGRAEAGEPFGRPRQRLAVAVDANELDV